MSLTKSLMLAATRALLLCCLMSLTGFGQQSGVLWYNPSTGNVGSWLQDGLGNVFGKPNVARICPSSWCSWELVGTGDFDNNGYPDVLWYNPSTGQVGSWLLDGAGQDLGVQMLNTPLCPQPSCSSGKIVGVGDFNNDGNQDILWYNATTGALDIWLLDGQRNFLKSQPHMSTDAPLCPQPGCTYGTIVGVGKFKKNDPNEDILWYDFNSGQLTVWILNGQGHVSSTMPVDKPCPPVGCGSVWSVIGVGDFNNDGNTDILWYNSSNGQVGSWLLDGTGHLIPVAGDTTVGQPGLQFLNQTCDVSCRQNWFPLAAIRFGPTIVSESWQAEPGASTGTLTLSGAYFTQGGTVSIHFDDGQPELFFLDTSTSTLTGTFTQAESGIPCDMPGQSFGITVVVTDKNNTSLPLGTPFTQVKYSTPCTL